MSRKAVAQLVGAPTDCLVFVSNATEGVNTVLRNFCWSHDARDVILTFSTAYEACAKAFDYLADYYPDRVEHRQMPLHYPLEDADVLRILEETIADVTASGKRARLCLFDVVSSRPGVVFPWVEVVKACRRLGVLSLVDGAQGVGMVRLDLAAADPDFFVSNCHKWLHVPRGCALFYVPTRNQHLLPTTLATSHGYQPLFSSRGNPLPPSASSAFVNNFTFVGTRDCSPYLCVGDAIDWRRRRFGSEDRILDYLWRLNKDGINFVAKRLGTTILENRAGNLTDCAMGNVALPIWVGKMGWAGRSSDIIVGSYEEDAVLQWLVSTMTRDHKTFMAVFVMDGRFWVRISAQVYLDMNDYRFAALVLEDLCERVGKGEHNQRTTLS